MELAPPPCYLCGARPASSGACCRDCLTPLAGPDAPRDVQVISACDPEGGAWLVDRDGHLSPVAPGALLGRRSLDVAIRHARVSREHARILRDAAGWSIEDLGSRHGTRVDGAAVVGRAPLRDGSVIHLGPVGLRFSGRAPLPAHLARGGTETASALAGLASDVSDDPPLGGALELTPPIPGGSGTLRYRGEALVLTPLQLDLLSLMRQRLAEDADKEADLRGWVSSTELMVSLPWDTAHPQPVVLKQLIRRVRERLGPLGLGVEGRHGLGYRLAAAGRGGSEESGEG